MIINVEDNTSIIRARALTDDGWLQVDEHGPRHVFTGARLAEKRIETVVATADRLVRRHLSIGLNAMFQTVQFPTRVTNLDAGLADMYGYALAL